MAEGVEVGEELEPEALELAQDVVVLAAAPQGEVALLQLPAPGFINFYSRFGKTSQKKTQNMDFFQKGGG